MDDVHERFARQAIELARQARAAGNHPFGALLVLDGDVVASAQNTVHTDRDPTAHAETNLDVARNPRDVARADSPQRALHELRAMCDVCRQDVLGRDSIDCLRPFRGGVGAARRRKFPGSLSRVIRESCRTGHGDRPAVLNEARDVHLGYWPAQAVVTVRAHHAVRRELVIVTVVGLYWAIPIAFAVWVTITRKICGQQAVR